MLYFIDFYSFFGMKYFDADLPLKKKIHFYMRGTKHLYLLVQLYLYLLYKVF